ncbi:hypothetical protein [Niastella populi]|uniref:DUF4595 domain-containing protein n=1 Tax=Niastella populi TaxID=550983 RepID=A0A1V9FGB0_9BACT|nr:hypothetical protein [Niastella populi]OQP57409.1 hypothetical protein A4R26_24640 [Niastella populi]
MKRIYCALLGLFVIAISCNKNDDNNDNPPAENREWFKLRSMVYTSQNNTSSRFYYDSTYISIDSVNNKIIFHTIEGTTGNLDTSMKTFTYNDRYQLVLYEQIDTYDQLYISRMEFVRDVDGKVSKVLSQYKDGLMASSEGLVKYDKRGDTTFVTFIDSTQKHRYGYTDANDFYQRGIVDDRVVYYKSYGKSSGKLDSSQTSYDYDAAGNLTTETYQYNNTTPVVYTYQHGSKTPKELQKFLSQWAGDLIWFTRSKLFGFAWELPTVSTFKGNVLLSKKQGSTIVQSYANTFDAGGNLASVTWQEPDYGSPSTIYTYGEKYYYHP